MVSEILNNSGMVWKNVFGERVVKEFFMADMKFIINFDKALKK
jgi:hypothetical protein